MRMPAGELRFPGNLRTPLPQAINRGFVHLERSRDVSHGLAFFQELRCYSNLIRFSLRGRPKTDTSLFGCLTTGSGSFPDGTQRCLRKRS
jgi:hypothetical protein